ncbi:MAG: MerR family transcriptional regulator [Dehalococcoidia bacterium]|nr:MerR family transcriptional regulator [Dehalococcoidia bacterium]
MLIRIGALSETTGVSEDVLRSWERRYGLLTPQRTAGGFRLYGDDDVQRVRTMVSLLSGGLSAGDAARHILETSVPAAANGSLPSTNAVVEELQGRLHGALRGFDDHALEAAIDAVLAALDLDTAIRDVFIPALKAIGDDWAAGTVSVAQEHFAVNVLRARLMALARGWDQGLWSAGAPGLSSGRTPRRLAGAVWPRPSSPRLEDHLPWCKYADRRHYGDEQEARTRISGAVRLGLARLRTHIPGTQELCRTGDRPRWRDFRHSRGSDWMAPPGRRPGRSSRPGNAGVPTETTKLDGR